MGDVFDINMEGVPVWANGLVVLTTICIVGSGAHLLVDSAARIAKRLGVSELVIGLTVVALGTSAPEFAVTLIAAFKGQGDISVERKLKHPAVVAISETAREELFV